jgi:hypothetical protein
VERVKGIEPSLSAWELATDHGAHTVELVRCDLTIVGLRSVDTVSPRRRPLLRAREGHGLRRACQGTHGRSR